MAGWDTENRVPKGLEADYEQGNTRHMKIVKTITQAKNMLERKSHDVGARAPQSPAAAAVSPRSTFHGSPKEQLRRASLERASLDSTTDRQAWWSRMDSASYNEPREEVRSDWATGSYVPQSLTPKSPPATGEGA